MPIYTDIIARLKTAIDAMTVAGGYNFNYNNVDQYKPSSMTYPNVKIHFPRETNRDPEGEVVNAYSADSEVTFECTVDNVTTPVDTALDKVVEDFKRLLEADHATLQTKGMIVGDYLEERREYTHVRARPGRVFIVFNIFYRVLKTNPASTT